MKNKNLLIAGSVIASATVAHADPLLIPNCDFETPAGANWAEGGAPNTTFDYPTTGGNPGGYGEMTNDGGGYGIFIANDNAVLTLDELGLTAGEAYKFSVDMKIFSGTNIGGFKVDFFSGVGGVGSTGDKFPQAGDVDPVNWKTYDFDVSIPPNADGIKLVPVWGSGSEVGFDNITFDSTPLVLPLIPNGDFEKGSESWFLAQNGGQTASYPGTDGNPDGHGRIDSVGLTGFGALVANNNTPMQLADLGLTAGETYTFTVDMKIFQGSNIGGLAVDFVPGGTGDLRPPAIIGDGSTWETYEFDVTIPEASTQIFVKVIWGEDSEVGFDNVDVIIPVEPPFLAEIKKGTTVTWDPDTEAGPAEFQYQAQRSTDGGMSWSDLGDPIVGFSFNAAFDPIGPPATYQVIESDASTLENAVLNSGFETTETPTYPSPGAPEWSIVSPEDTDPLDGTASILVGGTYEMVDPFEGSQMLVIESTTPVTGPVSPPNTDVRSGFNPVVGGTEYTITFKAAHPVKVGGANPQFNIFYYDENLLPVGGPIFESFASVGSDWETVEKVFTPPAGTEWMTIGWIQAMGAGNDWRWVTLIDDVSLPVAGEGGGGNPFVIPATAGPGIAVCWDTEADETYQVKCSSDLSTFVDYGPVISGTGSPATLADVLAPGSKFYRVEQIVSE